jgi:hypothetical protein
MKSVAQTIFLIIAFACVVRRRIHRCTRVARR